MLRFKLNNILIHVTGWLLFLAFPVLFLSSGSKQAGAWMLLSSPFYWLFCSTYLILFYFNLWYLIPQYFLKGNYWVYGLGVMLLFGGVFFLQPFDKLLINNPRFREQMELAARQQAADSLIAAAAHNRDTAILGPNGKSLPFGPLPHEDLRMQPPAAASSNGSPLFKHSHSRSWRRGTKS